MFHAVDHLVNNAGIGGIPKLIEDCSDATKYTSIIVSNCFVWKLIKSFFEN